MEAPKKRTVKTDPEMGEIILQAINKYEASNGIKIHKNIIKILISCLIFCFIVIMLTTVFYIKTINKMNESYTQKTESILITKAEIELTNQWERLPINQRKERLREQFFQIVRYYNDFVPENEKINDSQILDTFNQLWICTERLPHINFFLPIAYMKVKTNFNPIYDIEFEKGIAGFYLKTAESISNLPIVKNDPVFKVDYKGSITLYNPVESIKLLIARIDDLMIYFNNREDWVLFTLFNNEYEVISKFWEDGKGAIPDEYYREGQLAEALKYYHSFKNWQIPLINKN